MFDIIESLKWACGHVNDAEMGGNPKRTQAGTMPFRQAASRAHKALT